MVELRGFEPLTPCMPCKCATSCATAPCRVITLAGNAGNPSQWATSTRNRGAGSDPRREVVRRQAQSSLVAVLEHRPGTVVKGRERVGDLERKAEGASDRDP